MLKRYWSVAVIGGLLLQPFPAWAERRERDRHEEHRWGHGYVVRRVPPDYRTILWGGLSYLYCEGLFYKYTPVGYVIVEPPVGAVVPALPPGYATVTVQRTPYYFYEDTYYTTAPNGYVVAAPPAAVPVQAVPVQGNVALPAAVIEHKSEIDTYEIHIPNANGSYTLVELKKVEKGFVGPQGEFYPEHPTVEQLKVLYGKK